MCVFASSPEQSVELWFAARDRRGFRFPPSVTNQQLAFTGGAEPVGLADEMLKNESQAVVAIMAHASLVFLLTEWTPFTSITLNVSLRVPACDQDLHRN